MYIILLSILFLICSVSTQDVTFEYYRNLIQSNEEEAYHYNVPTNADRFRPRSPIITDYGTYDFIIIGAGAAGSVIANRLTEIKDWRVLLIEAGGKETDFSNIPAEMEYLQNLRFNWNFNTTVTTSCLGMINKQCPIPRGQALGGCTSINGMIYARGNKLDYDGWAKAGNTGWSYKDVLPYFIKSENCMIEVDPGYHGKGGYWSVEKYSPVNENLQLYIEATRELYNFTGTDYNGENQLGMFVAQLSIINGKRDSTAKAFLQPAETRNNLKILTNSYVIKILFKNKRAYGVRFSHGGKLHTAQAKKEVILSAGVINSPQILLLSGVGPSKHLREHGIPVVKDLSVGEVLQGHSGYIGLFFQVNTSEPVTTLDENIKEYLNGSGILTINSNLQGLGFFQSSYNNVPGFPDIEIQVAPSNGSFPFVERSRKLTSATYNGLWAKLDPRTTMNPVVILLHPKSFGSIKLKSSNPFEYPLIDLNFYSDPEGQDIDIVYQGIQIALRLSQTEAMKRINATVIYPDFPPCRSFPIGSRHYWYCCIRQVTIEYYHPQCSCRMGNDSRTSVVDPKLKIHGLEGIRVADSSVIPIPISGHTSSPSVMIGEKVSDIIKLEYKKPIAPITNTLY